MKHVSLFSGIGGFNLACDWLGIETIVNCEIDDFCCKVLLKHWPDVPIVKDVNDVEAIKEIVANARCLRPQERQEQTAGIIQRSEEAVANAYDKWQPQPEGVIEELRGRTLDRNQVTPHTTSGESRQSPEQEGREDSSRRDSLLLTAGFPCQPFSNAGRKRGASDNRYLWPQTLAVIKEVRPDIVLLENVAGLTNMVFPGNVIEMATQAIQAISNFNLFGWTDFPKTREIQIPFTHIQKRILGGIINDLENEGYDFERTRTGEPIVLCVPACGVGAPHRRDRVWIVSHSIRSGRTGDARRGTGQEFENGLLEPESQFTPNPNRAGSGTPGSGIDRIGQKEGEVNREQSLNGVSGQASPTSHASQQGLQGQQSGEPIRLLGQCDRIGSNERPDWQENWYEVATRFCRVDARVSNRVDRLKALGNSIVPEVAYQILLAIQEKYVRSQ